MEGTIPHLTACLATSLWLQWLMGRSLSSGASQASAIIAQICSGVNLPGAPAARRVAQTLRRALRGVRFPPAFASYTQPPRRLAHAIGCKKDDPRPLRQFLRRRMRPVQAVEFLRLLRCHFPGRSDTARHSCLHRPLRWRPYELSCPLLTRKEWRQMPLSRLLKNPGADSAARI